MALVDTDFVFRAANESYSRQVGIPLDEIVGRTTEALFPGWKPQVGHIYQQVRETGEPFQSQAHPFSLPNHPEQGTSYWDATISSVLGRGGECIGFLLLQRDVAQMAVTERKRAEERARVLEDVTELRQLEKYRQEYISIISHDLRNPLTPLLGQAQWLQRRLTLKEMEKEARSAEAIITSARRMNSMITDLLETTRLETGQMELHREPTDLGSLLSSLMDRTGTGEEPGRLCLEIPEYVPPVSVDTDRIERVVANLITNALKYSEPGTPVRLLLEGRDGCAVLSVIDQGPGIPPEDLAHLFERFYRARGSQKKEGLGLGLYISLLIVKAHGGSLWAESEPGKGSAFRVSLPIE